LRLNKIQQAAVTALEDIKATDIVPLDTRTLTSLYDAIIVATAESGRQTKALARNVQDKVRAAGGHVIAIEGEDSGEWVLVDCGELVVHIMLPATRVLYNLEELWTPSPQLRAARAPKSASKTVGKKPSTPRGNGANRDIAVTSNASTAKSAAPATKRPAAKKPAAKKPAASAPSSKKPASSKPIARKPAAKAPVARKPAAKKPAAKVAATKRPAAKKPATRKPAAKKPAAKKPAAKKR
jgi:ribosome-associated protein